jgi:hypothetical protein
MIHLELQPEIEAQLAAEAQARGLALDDYIEKIVASRPVDQTNEQAKQLAISEAIDRILELRESTNLGGLKIKDLIEEGRKY